MKSLLPYILLLTCLLGLSQTQGVPNDRQQRITAIKNRLEALAIDSPGLTDRAKTAVNVNRITLSNFILGISNAHGVNINVSPELNQTTLSDTNFSNVTVSDLLVFLCKAYGLTLEVTGNIIAIKKYVPPVETPKAHVVPVGYDPNGNTISIDAKGDKLYDVFKRIMDMSAKNLVFAPGLENKALTSYIKALPFDTAMETLALSNNLIVEKSPEGFYVFQGNEGPDNALSLRKRKNTQGDFKVLDIYRQLIEVNFENTPIKAIITGLGEALDLDVFTATPLDRAGTVTFKARSIALDDLLAKIFESQTPVDTASPAPEQGTSRNGNGNNGQARNQDLSSSSAHIPFSFKKENGIYYFGTEDQLSVRKVEVIHLVHRSVELLSDPQGGSSRNRTVGRSGYGSGYNSYRNYNNNFGYGSNYNQNRGYGSNTTVGNGTVRNNRTSANYNSPGDYNSPDRASGTPAQTIDAIIPPEIKDGLSINVDIELNSLYVTGAGAQIERLKRFMAHIDKAVPVILIEVMFVEVNRGSTIESGVSWGIGENPAETRGNLFPTTDFTLGAKTINRVINGFDGFDRLNLGKVVPNFFATVKAMESNGFLKIRSTPKLSTLNGHRATFSNGETSYYTVTQRNIYGTDNPQTSEITNYEPIDAELGLTIKPLVSGDGQVTLDIFVIQSSFGSRIDENAPPDISSREFSSVIRVQDRDIVVLGGLEEQIRNNSGSGVPLLARVPIIKWLFSSRKREASRSKMTVFIKPTILY